MSSFFDREYPAIFEQGEDKTYGIYIPDLGCVSHGDTFEDGINNIKEALTLHLTG
jgi:predicted RNase H-like HicB family nuclease